MIGDVGFHAHNNLGLAVGNTVAAIEAGATRVDGCLRGLGARDILVELGRRKAVAGQEDWIIDVAKDLAREAATASPA